MTENISKTTNKDQTSYTDLLFGKRDEYSLEHRFFNSVSLFSALAACFASITNIALQLSFILTAFTSFSTVILFSFYYISRKKKLFKPLILPYILYSLIILSIVWFFNAGSEGPVVFVYLVGLVLFVIITEGKNRIIVISCFLGNLVLLFYLERQYPGMVTPYDSDYIRFYDVAITFLFSFILMYFVVAILVKSYREEKIISTKQRDELIYQKKQITDSIQYAKSLQAGLLPDANTIKTILPNHFIFYKPKDIVSGDFYWVNKLNGRTIIATADCTGHGVPGAFMSVLGISLLNEIVRRKEVSKANQTLEILRYELKETLNQSHKDYSRNSGMDIALCVIDYNKKIIQYSGANAPLYLIRKNKLIEYKPTRNFIGLTPIEIPFLNNEIEYEEGDIFYLFSDGLMDQFGGEDGKKFRSRRFKHLLLEIHKKPLEIQKDHIKLSLLKWMENKYEQVDDILIFGFKP
ncbi:MAG: SpoIIE family protein phosphatase [Bacteroidales bacterium]|jgi:serine phosphatase RsbU (regulator of sigma subunit)|nr:SpoIIE family protein phosphatase [Bacteroidales bacterium]